VLAALALASIPAQASAFCGFYVSGATADLYNDATRVVMMRHGTKTVLSMQNHYKGPARDFAMIVPVPQVLKKDNVRILKDSLFEKIDRLTAPRLVEYREQDPCSETRSAGKVYPRITTGVSSKKKRPSSLLEKKKPVRVEAEFVEGEYEIQILSAETSNSLETWLEQEKYKIPKGAAKLFEPYIQEGMYFFAAKVDAEKVKFDKQGQAQLSPLRFHYDAETFRLPVRLGLINAKGHQDLLVHILAKGRRFEVANRENVTIPTNLVVDEKVEKHFGAFYAALFDATLEQNPGAAVTEYVWYSTGPGPTSGTGLRQRPPTGIKCDPCPPAARTSLTLDKTDLYTLGADIVTPPKRGPQRTQPVLQQRIRHWRSRQRTPWDPRPTWVLTRLHLRYTADELEDDLVFEAAEPIVGGRGTPSGEEGTLSEKGAKRARINQFQGRYVILHPWEGEVECEDPKRGRWGGGIPRGGVPARQFAGDTASAPRDKISVREVVRGGEIPGLDDEEEKEEKDNGEKKSSDGRDESSRNAPRGGPSGGSMGTAALALGLLSCCVGWAWRREW
jgi:hypothetical protein